MFIVLAKIVFNVGNLYEVKPPQIRNLTDKQQEFNRYVMHIEEICSSNGIVVGTICEIYLFSQRERRTDNISVNRTLLCEGKIKDWVLCENKPLIEVKTSENKINVKIKLVKI